jgi:hypothetical protein
LDFEAEQGGGYGTPNPNLADCLCQQLLSTPARIKYQGHSVIFQNKQPSLFGVETVQVGIGHGAVQYRVF